MRILKPSAHGVLDLVTVAIFALAPSVIGFGGGAEALSYVLAVVHLLMTLITGGLPVSVARLVPFPLHGIVEVVVGAALGLIGWLAFEGRAQAFYLIMGLVILLVFIVSDYGADSTQH